MSAFIEAMEEILYYASNTFPLEEGYPYWGLLHNGEVLCVTQDGGKYKLSKRGIPWVMKGEEDNPGDPLPKEGTTPTSDNH
jgi:hypothetical protein